MNEVIEPATCLRGEVSVPGDKSITHRALLLGAVADGDSVVRGYLDGGDCRASVAAVRALRVEVAPASEGALVVRGRGFEQLSEPEEVVNCDGSGTTMRLLAGLLSGLPLTAVLTGNEALRRRPMARIIEPLRQMGATVLGRAGDRLPPLLVRGGSLHGIHYSMPVASAQLKSCLLLAGLRADSPTTVREPAPSRDHTERMLMAMGATVVTEVGRVRVSPVERLEPIDVCVPGDLSSAAFLVAAALLVPGSQVRVKNVGVNPTRTGFLDVVAAMGGRVHLDNQRLSGGEPVADLVVSHCGLRATTVEGALVPLTIDELPLVATLATQAEGVTTVRDAAELRVKESDRVSALVTELRRLGARIEEAPDGFTVVGPTPLRGTTVSTHRDHRLAMALAVAALVARGPTTIVDAEYAADSYPGFYSALASLQQ